MNKDIITGKWKEIKGDLIKAWGKVTGDEWEQTRGDATAISGVLQQKYGMAKDEANDKVSGFMSKYTEQARDKVNGSPTKPT